MTTCNFGQYIVLHHLDDKNHISDRLGKQKFSNLSSYGHLFWQFPQKCTFWDFWLKSGDFESKYLKKKCTTSLIWCSFQRKSQAHLKFLGHFGFWTVLGRLGYFGGHFWAF